MLAPSIFLLLAAHRRKALRVGLCSGGMGVTRELLFLEDAVVSIQSERRRLAPRGIVGGGDGSCGQNILRRVDGMETSLPGRTTFQALKGETVIIHTPGGGGWGEPS